MLIHIHLTCNHISIDNRTHFCRYNPIMVYHNVWSLIYLFIFKACHPSFFLALNRNFFQKIIFAGGQTKNPLVFLMKDNIKGLCFFSLFHSLHSLFIPHPPCNLIFSTLHLKDCQALFALIIRTQSVQLQVHYKNSQRLGGLLIRHYVCGGVEMYTGLVAHQIDSPVP